MPTTMTLYTYAAIAAPLTQALTEVIERQVAAWGPTLDDTIAEMLVRALAANGADGAHHHVLDRAEVWVWRVHEGEQSPYVAAVEGPDLRVHTFIPDAQPATLEALVERLCLRDERAYPPWGAAALPTPPCCPRAVSLMCTFRAGRVACRGSPRDLR